METSAADRAFVSAVANKWRTPYCASTINHRVKKNHIRGPRSPTRLMHSRGHKTRTPSPRRNCRGFHPPGRRGSRWQLLREQPQNAKGARLQASPRCSSPVVRTHPNQPRGASDRQTQGGGDVASLAFLPAGLSVRTRITTTNQRHLFLPPRSRAEDDYPRN